jgi:Fe-S oxidoreductase
MSDNNTTEIDSVSIQNILNKHKTTMKLSLKVCAHCTMCAESCFLYMIHKQPEYMPSYKFIHSIGKTYKKKGKVTRAFLEKARDLVWENCVLCTRCYCPIGIDIPSMIAVARSICRSQGIEQRHDK